MLFSGERVVVGSVPCPNRTLVSEVQFDRSLGVNVATQTGAISKLQCSCAPGTYHSAVAGKAQARVVSPEPDSSELVSDQVNTTNVSSLEFYHITNSLNSTELMPTVFSGDYSCLACPEGAECLGNLLPPVARPGYGVVPSVSTAAFYECRNAAECPGPDCDCLGGAHHIDSVGISVTRPMTCGEGYVDGSNLCSECDRDAGYASSLGACKVCQSLWLATNYAPW